MKSADLNYLIQGGYQTDPSPSVRIPEAVFLVMCDPSKKEL